jgi:tetratricopeptide (TPR) repeat protein
LQELHASMESSAVGVEHSVGVGARVRRALRRGLSVDPSQRFANMGELLAALEPTVRRRRGWIAGAVLVVAGAGAAVWGVAVAGSVDPCADAAGDVARAWSLERQTAMHAAFLRSDLPYAEAGWLGVKSRLDGYAGRLRDEAIGACRATFVAHAQSEQLYDKRRLCFERGRRQLSALVTELATGAPDAVQGAVDAAEALPDVQTCSRTENLMLGLDAPPAALAHRVGAVRDQLARALTLEMLGRTEESLVVAREASTSTEHLGYAPVHAEALAQTARALDGRGTAEARSEAEHLYFDALDIAEAERHDQLAVEIWNRLVLLAVRMDSGTEQARAWSRRHAAAVHRIGDTAYEVAKLHHMRAEIDYRESKYAEMGDEENLAITAIAHAPEHQVELSRYYDALAKSLQHLDRLDEAIALHERALNIATGQLGGAHPDVIKLQINYGNALQRRGHFDRARSVLEGALASMTSHYRESHPDAGKLHGMLSDLSYRENKLDDAAAHARASLEIFDRARSPARLRDEAYVKIANVEMRRRNFTGALGIYQQVLALRRQYLKDNSYQLVGTEGSIAEALVELGRFDEALPHLREAKRMFEQGAARDVALHAWLLTLEGELLIGQRQFGAAVPVLERALPLFDETSSPDNQGLAMWSLARALQGLEKEPARVRQLAERAQAIFATLGATEVHNREAVRQFIERLSPSPASHGSPSGGALTK